MKTRHFVKNVEGRAVCSVDTSKDKSCEFSDYIGENCECIFKLEGGTCVEPRVLGIVKL